MICNSWASTFINMSNNTEQSSLYPKYVICIWGVVNSLYIEAKTRWDTFDNACDVWDCFLAFCPIFSAVSALYVPCVVLFRSARSLHPAVWTGLQGHLHQKSPRSGVWVRGRPVADPIHSNYWPYGINCPFLCRKCHPILLLKVSHFHSFVIWQWVVFVVKRHGVGTHT